MEISCHKIDKDIAFHQCEQSYASANIQTWRIFSGTNCIQIFSRPLHGLYDCAISVFSDPLAFQMVANTQCTSYHCCAQSFAVATASRQRTHFTGIDEK
jgi:hypothetical protein